MKLSKLTTINQDSTQRCDRYVSGSTNARTFHHVLRKVGLGDRQLE